MSRNSFNTSYGSITGFLFFVSISSVIFYFHIEYSKTLSTGYFVAYINRYLLELCQGYRWGCYSFFYKSLALFFLTLALYTTRVRMDDPISKQRALVYLGVCLAVFNLRETVEFFGVKITQKVDTYGVIIGYMGVLYSLVQLKRQSNTNLLKDVFNIDNESFLQQKKCVNTPDSINLPTEFYYKNKWHKGWLNLLNPYRGTLVLGTPGSGKSYTIINSFITQHIEKGFSMLIYDFKFSDLTLLAYNTLLTNPTGYSPRVKFYVLNFDDVQKSHRCNPLQAESLTDISDAYQAAKSILLNLNRSWIQKQGDFFVESPILLLSAVIWFLKIYENGKYCTLPHAIEFINQPYEKIFRILSSYAELQNYLSPFTDALQAGAQDQLQGQIASVKIPLSRLISKNLYWIMSHSDFTLDLNNPLKPKILCLGNNPGRQDFYSAALGLYSSRIVKLINQKQKLKCSLILDELPTIYFNGLDQLIATARSNKVSVTLGIQDYSQLVRDYGDKESRVILQTVGNIFSGQTLGETAKHLSERFGKVLQKRNAFSLTDLSRSDSVSTQLDMLIPSAKISSLKQGFFVASLSDQGNQRQVYPVFHGKIIIDKHLKKGESNTELPVITSFKYKSSLLKQSKKQIRNNIVEQLDINFKNIKSQVIELVNKELNRLSDN
ncbi:type IV secretory system conjugative DNA transfer family protein [Myroides sp. LJL119]